MFTSMNEVFTQRDIYINQSYSFQTYYHQGSLPIVFFCHHGAGSSGMTFGPLVQSLKKLSANGANGGFNGLPGVFTFDSRGHGDSKLLSEKNQTRPNTDEAADQFTPTKVAEKILEEGEEEAEEEEIDATPTPESTAMTPTNSSKSKMASKVSNILQAQMFKHLQSPAIHSTNTHIITPPPVLSLDQLTSDAAFILEHFISKVSDDTEIYLIGHSLGGSVLTNVLHTNALTPKAMKQVKGLTMIDIVEETAVKSLPHMSNYLRNLPKSFTSVDQCIQWHLQTKLLNNEKSARMSIPALITSPLNNGKFYWITNLYSSIEYWNGWFQDLSQKFLDAKGVAKLLILANNDYLDKPLIIGQMQGKYQLVVFRSQDDTITTLYGSSMGSNSGDSSQVGHFIHEDIPHKFTLTILDYLERNNDKFYSMKNKDQHDVLRAINEKWSKKKS